MGQERKDRPAGPGPGTAEATHALDAMLQEHASFAAQAVEKALVFAISPRGLLAFDEPDFPDVPWQVPGGTIEPGEAPEAAARREFAEETGLTPAVPFTPLITELYGLTGRGGRVHRRHVFHLVLGDGLPETWEHVEEDAHNGAGPIRFRFGWLRPAQAARRLGLGFDRYLPLVPGGWSLGR